MQNVKTNTIFLLFTLLALGTFAQQAFERKFEFDKKIVPVVNGVGRTTEMSAEMVMEVVEKKFEEGANAKSKKARKDIIVFEGVIMPQISSAKMDYYFRVEENKKDKNLIQMFLSLGNNNFISSNKFPSEIEAAKRFLDNLNKDVRLQKMAAMIEAQKEKVEEMEKDREKVMDDKEDLVKDHEKLMKDLKENEAEQEKVKAEAEKLTEKLDQMKKELARLEKEMEGIR